MRLVDLLDQVIERNPRSDAVVFSVSERFGVIPQDQIFKKKIALDDKSKYLRVQTGDVVYNSYLLWNGAVGVCFDKRGGCTSPAYVVLRPRHKGIDRFLHYFLRSATFTSAVDAIASGSVTRRRTAPVEDILNLEFRLPQLSEQRAASTLLCEIDDKIELNRRMNETLEVIARAMFKSWFVDFDPVRAKMSGELPESICQRLGLTPDLLALFPNRLGDSKLGEIPEGWSVQSFDDGVEIIGGGTPKTSVPEFWDGEIPWFSVVDAPSGSDVWVVDTDKKITREGIENSSAKILPIGTTIISARGTVGKIALVGVPMAMNQSCYGLRGKVGIGLFNYFATQRLVSTLQQRVHGSVFDTITRATLEGVDTVTPSSRIIDGFEELMAPCMETIRTNILQSRTLCDLRDSLLPKLLCGELRVPNAEGKLRVIA